MRDDPKKKKKKKEMMMSKPSRRVVGSWLLNFFKLYFCNKAASFITLYLVFPHSSCKSFTQCSCFLYKNKYDIFVFYSYSKKNFMEESSWYTMEFLWRLLGIALFYIDTESRTHSNTNNNGKPLGQNYKFINKEK